MRQSIRAQRGRARSALFSRVWFKEMVIGMFSFLQRSFYILIWTTVPSMPLKNFHVTGLWPFSLRYDHVLSFFFWYFMIVDWTPLHH